MTITNVQLFSEMGSDDKDKGRSYTEIYSVEFTAGYSTAALLANTDARLPKRGWYLGQSSLSVSTDSNVYVTHVEPKLDDASQAVPISGNVGMAVYTVSYETPSLTIFDKQLSPLSRPAQIRWGGSDATEVRKYDANGDPIANSAGDFYADLPEFYIRGGEVSITLNVASNPAHTCVDYSFTTNDSSWYGVAAGNALLGKIEATKQFETFQGTDYTYWQLTYPIAFRRDGWGFKTFDYGFRWVDDSDQLQVWLDKNGSPSPTPTLLDSIGRPWDGNPIPWPDGTTADEGGFKIYEDASWSSLSLPNPFA